MSDAFSVTQRHVRLKRVLLAPVAPVARTWAFSGKRTTAKAAALRSLVAPKLVADGREFVTEVDPGVRFGDDARDLLGMMVALFGVWEPNLTQLLASRLRPGDTFVDVGAHRGWFSLQAAHRVGPTGEVVAIEASPANAERLRANVARNPGVAPVRVVHAAAGAEEGFVAIEEGPAEHTGLSRIRALEAATATSVRMAPLPALLERDELQSARLVKIDVEGAEYDVVAGLAEHLGSLRPDAEVVVEVGPERAARPGQVEALLEQMAAGGFTPYVLPNLYQVRDYYFAEPLERLARLEAVPTSETDVVFSRASSPHLEL